MRKATHEGILPIGTKSLSCAVLDDGTRVLTQTAVFEAFDRPRRGKSIADARADQVPSFMDAKNLQPFVTQSLMERTNVIEYRAINGQVKTGYDARILRNLCKLYIDADEAGALVASQARLVVIAKEILFALSEVGITALVDEATGYQYERERNELQIILAKYVSDELLPWQKTFPDQFYQNIFRLNGWDYTVQSIKKRPGVVGKWTNKLIYDQLPSGVLETLKTLTKESGRGERYHQHLTENIGYKHLKTQIDQVTGMMKLCDTWNEFINKFNRTIEREAEERKIEEVVDDSIDMAEDDEYSFRFQRSLFDQDL